MYITDAEREALNRIKDKGKFTKEDIMDFVSKENFDRFLVKFAPYLGCIYGSDWFLNEKGKEFLENLAQENVFESDEFTLFFDKIKESKSVSQIYVKVERKDNKEVYDDTVNFKSSRNRNKFIDVSAKELKINRDKLYSMFKDLRLPLENLKEKQKVTFKSENVCPFAQEIMDAAMDVLKNGNPLEYILKAVNKIHIGDNVGIAIAALSRTSLRIKNEKALHVQVVARSGKGKSDLLKKFSLVIPDTGKKVFLHELSSKTIEYASEVKNLDGYHFIIEEAEGSQESIPTLRALTDTIAYEGIPQEVRSWTVREQSHLELCVNGKQLIWLASVQPVSDLQLINRILLFSVDESKEQDDAVLKFQKEQQIKKKALPPEFQIIKAMFYFLETQEDEIVIPYILLLDWGFVENRRDFPFFSILIKSCAKMFKLQREVVDGRIVANRTDFEIAKFIWLQIAHLQATKLSENDLRILNVLPTTPDDALSRQQIGEKLGMSTSIVIRHLNYLESLENSPVSSDKTESGALIYWRVRSNYDYIIHIDWKQFIPDFLKETLNEMNIESNDGALVDTLCSKILTTPNSFFNFMTNTFNYTPELAMKKFQHLSASEKVENALALKVLDKIPTDEVTKDIMVDKVVLDFNVDETTAKLLLESLEEKQLIDSKDGKIKKHSIIDNPDGSTAQ